MIQTGDYVKTISGPEAPMRVMAVGDGWVEVLSGCSYHFRIETALIVKI